MRHASTSRSSEGDAAGDNDVRQAVGSSCCEANRGTKFARAFPPLNNFVYEPRPRVTDARSVETENTFKAGCILG